MLLLRRPSPSYKCGARPEPLTNRVHVHRHTHLRGERGVRRRGREEPAVSARGDSGEAEPERTHGCSTTAAAGSGRAAPAPPPGGDLRCVLRGGGRRRSIPARPRCSRLRPATRPGGVLGLGTNAAAPVGSLSGRRSVCSQGARPRPPSPPNRPAAAGEIRNPPVLRCAPLVFISLVPRRGLDWTAFRCYIWDPCFWKFYDFLSGFPGWFPCRIFLQPSPSFCLAEQYF